MLQSDIIKSIDSDIDKHHSKASEMLSNVEGILAIGLVILLIYVAPGIAERALPKLEEESKAEKVAYAAAVADFKAKYKVDYAYISHDDYKEHKKNHTVTETMESARDISVMERGDSFILPTARFIAKLKVEDSKIEFVLTILPYLTGVILAGFLITYRLHVISARELALKKFDIFAQTARTQDDESLKKS